MSATLLTTAFVMGLAGAPHCAAMCGAACAGIAQSGSAARPSRAWAFQGGRLAGYSIAGAAVSSAAGGLSWMAQHTQALRPAWTLLHLAVLAWGLTLLVMARQPAWLDAIGRTVWSRVRLLAARGSGTFATGVLWAFMPCGLLYSALLVASLAGGVAEGALAMALFAGGSSTGLWLAPRLWSWAREHGNRWRRDLGTRAAGAMLVATSAIALWTIVADRVAAWCGLPA